jgi:hypothetical protein
MPARPSRLVQASQPPSTSWLLCHPAMCMSSCCRVLLHAQAQAVSPIPMRQPRRHVRMPAKAVSAPIRTPCCMAAAVPWPIQQQQQQLQQQTSSSVFIRPTQSRPIPRPCYVAGIATHSAQHTHHSRQLARAVLEPRTPILSAMRPPYQSCHTCQLHSFLLAFGVGVSQGSRSNINAPSCLLPAI